MKIYRAIPLTLASFVMCFSASGEGLEFEAGYSRVQVELGSSDVDLGALYGNLGYRWDYSDVTFGTVEGYASIGIQNDNFGPVDIDLDVSYGVAYRITRKINDDFNVFGRVTYAQYNLGVDASSFGGGSGDADDSGGGFSVGAEYNGFTLTYNAYFGDLKTLDIGYRFRR